MFASLPDDARVWTFLTDRPVDAATRGRLAQAVDDFLRSWTSHGRPVPAQADWLAERVFVVAAHLGTGPNAGVSGCGIDALVHALEETARREGFGWADGLQVAFRDPTGVLQVVPRAAFRALAREGHVDAHTRVLDLTVDRLGDLRTHGLERPAAHTWHARAFGLGEPAGS